MPRKLGRRKPKNNDFSHVEKYPLRDLEEVVTNTPVALGINWYSNFDQPQLMGSKYWIGIGDLGHVRGGHAICLKPRRIQDPSTRWKFYDQGEEGACVGFACSRMMGLLNDEKYNAFWLYRQAQEVDEWDETPPEEGTSVNAACKVLQEKGAKIYKSDGPDVMQGISAYRWATTWDEVRSVLGIPDSEAGVPLLNSWGEDYPHVVRITDEAGARVLSEYGEAAIVTDR
jgi:hypothetical protein